jgi:hypothetical protein
MGISSCRFEAGLGSGAKLFTGIGKNLLNPLRLCNQGVSVRFDQKVPIFNSLWQWHCIDILLSAGIRVIAQASFTERTVFLDVPSIDLSVLRVKREPLVPQCAITFILTALARLLMLSSNAMSGRRVQKKRKDANA